MEASGNAWIVAEDLGCVPKYVRPLLKTLGMAGFAIPIFERDEDDRSFKPSKDYGTGSAWAPTALMTTSL